MDRITSSEIDKAIFKPSKEDKNDVQDKDDRHRIDHKYAMISHDYNLPAWSWIGQQFFGSIQNCINDYFNKYSILKADRFLLHDLKIKKIPPGGGFH